MPPLSLPSFAADRHSVDAGRSFRGAGDGAGWPPRGQPGRRRHPAPPTNAYFRRRLSPSDIAAALARFHTEARIQPITAQVSGIATHPQDDLILATALSAQAQYLVAGDKPLLERGAYGGTRLLSPRQFLDHLD